MLFIEEDGVVANINFLPIEAVFGYFNSTNVNVYISAINITCRELKTP